MRVLILHGVLRDFLAELAFLETYSVQMDVYPPLLSMSLWRMADGVVSLFGCFDVDGVEYLEVWGGVRGD